MPIIVEKGLPGDEEARLAALRLKKKLRADSRGADTHTHTHTHTGTGSAHANSIMGAMSAGGGMGAGDVSADSSGDERDEEAIYRRAQLLYARPSGPDAVSDAAGASSPRHTVGDSAVVPVAVVTEGEDVESKRAAKRRRMKQRMPSACLTPLVALTDLMTLKVYKVTRPGPWDTAPPATLLLGDNMGFAGVGEGSKLAEDAAFQRHLKDARKSAEGAEADTARDAQVPAAAVLADPTPLQRLRYLRAKGSYNRPATKDKRLSDLVKVSEERKHAVKQGATISSALSPRSASYGLPNSSSVGVPARQLSGGHMYPTGELGVVGVSSQYSISSERHGGLSTQGSVTDMQTRSVYSTTTLATSQGGDSRRVDARPGSSGGAAPARSTTPLRGDRPRSNSHDSWAQANGAEAPSVDIEHMLTRPQTGHSLDAQQKRAQFLAALEWAVSMTGECKGQSEKCLNSLLLRAARYVLSCCAKR